MASTTPEPAFAQGAVVRFTRGPLGTHVHPNDVQFAEHTVAKGDQGLYEGPHTYKGLDTRGWHVVSVAHEGRTLYVPVHASQIEAA